MQKKDPDWQKISDSLQAKETEIVTWLTPVRDWFNGLPTVGKVAVGIGTLAVSFSLLNTVLRLVFSLLTLGFVGAGIYVLYKFVINSDTSE